MLVLLIWPIAIDMLIDMEIEKLRKPQSKSGHRCSTGIDRVNCVAVVKSFVLLILDTSVSDRCFSRYAL